jgi:hypothetical protein
LFSGYVEGFRVGGRLLGVFRLRRGSFTGYGKVRKGRRSLMATRPKKVNFFAIREETEFQASQVRGQYRLGYRDIGDIFRFMEQAMGYLLISLIICRIKP